MFWVYVGLDNFYQLPMKLKYKKALTSNGMTCYDCLWEFVQRNILNHIHFNKLMFFKFSVRVVCINVVHQKTQREKSSQSEIILIVNFRFYYNLLGYNFATVLKDRNAPNDPNAS